MRFSHKATEPVEELEEGFPEFRWDAIAQNRITVGLEIDRLWNKLMKDQSPPTILTGSESKTHSEKLRVMKDKYKIDERAIKDFDLLEGLTKDSLDQLQYWPITSLKPSRRTSPNSHRRSGRLY